MKINLPHLEPIRFAQELLSLKDLTCAVSVKFPTLPSLAMIVEAAAQSSAGFAKENEEVKAAFLVILKDIQLLNKCKALNIEITLNVEQQVDKITYFSFEAKNIDIIIATGTFAIAEQ